MDWNALKVFLAIVRNGSLSGAAHELGVNHSTVFRRLNSFEGAIGGRLFARINNRYELTSMGDEVLQLAKTIEDSFDSMERHIVGQDFQPKGIVKITAPANIAYRYLARYLTEFNAVYPDIQIELLVSNLEFNMSNRQADIAVRATSAPPELLVGRQVKQLSWNVYGSRQYVDKHGLPETAEELTGHALIGATGAISHLPAFSWQAQHYAMNIVARSDDLTAMSCFAEAGRGLAFLPEDQSRPDLLKLLPLPVTISSDLWLLTHQDLRHVERIKLVMQFLTRAFSEEWI